MGGSLSIPGAFVPQPDPTSLSAGHFSETGILNNIFKEVMGMTHVLQSAAAAQANSLTVDTQWQQAYTARMGEVPTFTGTGHFGGSSTSQISLRGQLNQLNASYTQTLQNRQSVVSDNAKSLQSNVSQTNDAVNAQSNLGTAVLQNMATILSSMYP